MMEQVKVKIVALLIVGIKAVIAVFISAYYKWIGERGRARYGVVIYPDGSKHNVMISNATEQFYRTSFGTFTKGKKNKHRWICDGRFIMKVTKYERIKTGR